MACNNYEQITEEEGELTKIFLEHCMPRYRTGYVRIGPEKVVMPNYYLELKGLIDNFEVRPDDVWVLSYPKAGTTWTQEMVWCIANNLDFVGAQRNLEERFPFFEFSCLFDLISPADQQSRNMLTKYVGQDSVSGVHRRKSPRFIKSHLPWQMLPKQLQGGVKKPKIVYVSRNAKDTCLSMYHFWITLKVYEGDFETFTKLFLADLVVYSPFWSHVLKAWDHRHEENVLFLKYEDMKKDLPSVIRQTAAFLGKTLTESQVQTLADHLSFTKMKDNPAVNFSDNHKPGQTPFMRKGEVGQWKTDMSPELVEQFDKWTREHVDGTELIF